MLRACTLALTALDAVAGFSAVLRGDPVWPFAFVPAGIKPLVVADGEDLRNRDLHGAAFRAVVARRARDGLVGEKRFLRFCDDPFFLRGQRLEVSHIGEVILHLCDVAHPRQNGYDMADAGCEADRPAGIGERTAILSLLVLLMLNTAR